MAVPAILLPADPLTPRRADAHFRAEGVLVRELGGATALVDHDALLAGDVAEAVRRVPTGLGPAWYRGWMIPAPRYAELAAALAARGCSLLTTPTAYVSAHELPGWYDVFDGATPASVWLPGTDGPPSRAALAEAARALGHGHGDGGPAVVKDYVKSRKEAWHEACFVPDTADTDALHRVVSRFVELQGDYLTGGVVLRAFEAYDTTRDPSPTRGSGTAVEADRAADTSRAVEADRAVEARVWWLDGEPVLTGPHPDTPHLLPAPDLSAVRPLVRALGCRFVTTDLALRTADHTWRVVEVGDGQVSDLPQGTDPSPLLAALVSA